MKKPMMTHILILISSGIPLTATHFERLRIFVGDKGIVSGDRPVWLDGDKAVELAVKNSLTLLQMKELRNLFAQDRIDVLCISVAGRKKKLLLADMDATIVAGETLDELAARAGIKDQIAAITARAMNGELDFKAALRARVWLLKGLSVAALQETLDETDCNAGAEDLVSTMRDAGATCVLVSGGFTFFTAAIAKRCGFHRHHGNVLNHNGETLDGTVKEPILDKDSKLAFLKSYAQDLEIDLAQTLAIGDGANDLPMLTAAGLGIGYRPKPVLEDVLMNVLRYADLDRLKYVLAK